MRDNGRLTEGLKLGLEGPTDALFAVYSLCVRRALFSHFNDFLEIFGQMWVLVNVKVNQFLKLFANKLRNKIKGVFLNAY